MSNRIVMAGAFAAASVLATAAYAGSPYYDADGQALVQPAPRVHAKAQAERRSSVVAAAPIAARPRTETGAAMPSLASDGFAAPAGDSEAFDHAVGTDGSTVASGESASAPEAAPVYSAPLPRMDADGFEHAEGDKSLYEHAVGTDGSQVESQDAAPAPKTAPVYTAAMPKMDADGFAHPESGNSYYNHAVGTDGSP